MDFRTVAEIALERIFKISYQGWDCEQWENSILPSSLGDFQCILEVTIFGEDWNIRYLISLAGTTDQVFKVKQR